MRALVGGAGRRPEPCPLDVEPSSFIASGFNHLLLGDNLTQESAAQSSFHLSSFRLV